jgi:hypothetical protein
MNKLRILLIGGCAAAAIVLAADGLRGAAKPPKLNETWVEGIPKAWGRLVNASSFGDGSTVLFFEATDGTLRRVWAKFHGTDIQYGLHVTVIPRL